MKIVSTKELALLTAGLVFVTMTVDAGAENSGYVTDQRGAAVSESVVRSGTGLCWHNGAWTPEQFNAECDPSRMPKQAAYAAPRSANASATEKVSMSAGALFDFDKSNIKPDGKAHLDEIIHRLNLRGAELGVIVSTGHTDSTGSDAYNMKLSERRAEAVKDYLVSQGIDGNRIRTEGLGERQPVADNVTSTGRAANRHVEIEVASTRTQ